MRCHMTGIYFDDLKSYKILLDSPAREKLENFLKGKTVYADKKTPLPNCNKIILDKKSAKNFKSLFKNTPPYLYGEKPQDKNIVIGDLCVSLFDIIGRIYYVKFFEKAPNDGHFKVHFSADDFLKKYGSECHFLFNDYNRGSSDGIYAEWVTLRRIGSKDEILYDRLSEIIKKFDMINRTFYAAREKIVSYIAKEPEEANKNGFTSAEAVHLNLESASYVINCYDNTFEDAHIKIVLNMCIDSNNRGYYSLLFDSVTGTATDGFFVTE